MNGHKAFTGFELKSGGRGEFSAVFATFDVIDRDGDVTLRDAFRNGQAVPVGAWNHDMEQLPVGKGIVRVRGNSAIVEGAFNLATSRGHDTYEAIKDLGDLVEWSYIFKIVDSERGSFDGNPVRFLKRLDVVSVDPVVRGAGIGTRTVALKRHRPVDTQRLFMESMRAISFASGVDVEVS